MGGRRISGFRTIDDVLPGRKAVKMVLDRVKVIVSSDAPLDKHEIRAYIQRGRRVFGPRLAGLSLIVSKGHEETVQIEYRLEGRAYESIERRSLWPVGNAPKDT